MPEERTVKKVFKNTAEGKRSVGKPRNRRFDNAENHLKKMCIRGWRKTAKDRDAWKLIRTEARDPTWTAEPVERERKSYCTKNFISKYTVSGKSRFPEKK